MPKLSIVIPCYNEQKRLPRFFDPFIKKVEQTKIDFNCYLVDDGSIDQTLKELKERAQKDSRIIALTHQPNRGRGYSVRQGVLAATGGYIFETDVDGSYDVDEMIKFVDYLDAHSDCDLVIATREHREANAVVQQPRLRVFAGKVFHALFRLVFGGKFTDVMAGCKLYRQAAAKDIFFHQYDNEFLGAAETVFAADKLGYKIIELPVTWQDDAEGSKVSAWRAARRTLVGLLKMKIREWQGKYKK